MSVTFDLYRLKTVDPNETLAKDNNAPSTFKVVAMSQIEETVEREGGGFRLSNVTITAEGLALDYFEDADDINKPYVLEITDSTGLIFHGPIDPKSVRYDRKTEQTKFTVLSWESLLSRAGSVPARSVFETQINSVVYYSPFDWIDFPEGTVINRGDVIVADGVTEEIRVTIEAVGTVDGFPRAKVYLPEPRGLGLFTDNTDWTIQSPASGAQDFLDFADNRHVAIFKEYYPPTEVDSWGNPRWALTQEIGTPRLLFFDSSDRQLRSLVPIFITYYANSFSVNLGFVGGGISDFDDETTKIQLVGPPIGLEAGANVRILGKDVYGEEGFLAGAPWWNYPPSDLIDAIFSLGGANAPDEDEGKPFGIMPNVFRNVLTVGDDIYAGTIPRYVEFSDNPLEALRQIQMTTKTLLRIIPVVDSGFPRFDVQMIDRAEVNPDTGDVTAVASSLIEGWDESPVQTTYDAVIVRANNDYFARTENTEYLGVWFERPDGAGGFDTIDDIASDTPDQLAFMGVPKGPNILEIEVLHAPAFTADYSFQGDGRPVFNDDYLKEIAKYYYRFYTDLNRAMSGTLSQRAPDILGKLVSFDEGGLQETVLVTKTSTDLKFGEARTKISGFIAPTFIPPTAVAPIAVISGPRVWEDLDDSGDETVTYSAAGTTNPTGNTQTFAWSYRPLGGGWTSFGSDFIESVLLNVGSYEIRLGVTDDGTGLQGSSIIAITVQDATTSEGGDPRQYTDEQWESGGTGYARLFPNVPSAIDTIYWRKTSGTELPEIDWSQPLGTIFPETPLTQADEQTDPDNGAYYEFSTALDPNGLSYIEIYVTFHDSTIVPLMVRWSMDSDAVADVLHAALRVDASGDVFIDVTGDNDTLTSNGIKVYTSVDDANPVPWVEHGSSPFDNPLLNQQIHSALASGSTLYVQVEVLNASDSTVGDTWYGSITAVGVTTGSSFDYIQLADLERVSHPAPVTGLLGFDSDSDGTNEKGLQIQYPGSVWAVVWDSNNHGANSGMIADMVDGYHGSDLAAVAENESITGEWTFRADLLLSRLGDGDHATVELRADDNKGCLFKFRHDATDRWWFRSAPNTWDLQYRRMNHATDRDTVVFRLDYDTTEVELGGPTTVSDDLTVTGASTVEDLTVNTTLDVTGASTFSQKATFQATLGDCADFEGFVQFQDDVFYHPDAIITSDKFVSGFGGEGFRVAVDAVQGANFWQATFDELWVRGTFHVYELLVQQIRATNGSIIVANAAKVKSVVDNGGNSYTMEFDLDWIVFEDDDLLLAQRLNADGTEIFKTRMTVTATTATTVTATLYLGDDAPQVGWDFVRIGNLTDADRQGSIYLTADDQNAPYIDVRDEVDSHGDWGSGATKVRLGDLTGITDATYGALTGYGLWSDTAYITGVVYASEGRIGTPTAAWTFGTEGSGPTETAFMRSSTISSYRLFLEAGQSEHRMGVEFPGAPEAQDVYIYRDGSDWGLVGHSDGYEFFHLGSSNQIAGWSFNELQISNNNIAIRSGSSGYIRSNDGTDRWRLNNTGSGELASGNISWDNDGNVTLAPSVTITYSQISDLQNLLADYVDVAEDWSDTSYPPTGWGDYGDSDNNEIVHTVNGPFGFPENLWYGYDDKGSAEGGGPQQSTNATLDTTKNHRLTWYWKRDVGSDGEILFDLFSANASVFEQSDGGTPLTTFSTRVARFHENGDGTELGRWYCTVIYLWAEGFDPDDDSGTSWGSGFYQPRGGHYDMLTGEKVGDLDHDVQWAAAAGATEGMRMHSYVANHSSCDTYWGRPRIDVVNEYGYGDGSAITLESLLIGNPTMITNHLVSSPLIQGATIEATEKLYLGTGTYSNDNTPFYADDTGGGRVSFGSRVTWDGTDFKIIGDVEIDGGNLDAGNGKVRLDDDGLQLVRGSSGTGSEITWRSSLGHATIRFGIYVNSSNNMNIGGEGYIQLNSALRIHSGEYRKTGTFAANPDSTYFKIYESGGTLWVQKGSNSAVSIATGL